MDKLAYRSGSHDETPITQSDTEPGSDPTEEDIVLQISGQGYWYRGGWIGDHPVDFLIDSVSSVTALSAEFYDNIVAPMGELRSSSKK